MEAGLPADLIVGLSLLGICVFILVLAASGALGDGKSHGDGGHGSKTVSRHVEPAKGKGTGEKPAGDSGSRAGKAAGVEDHSKAGEGEKPGDEEKEEPVVHLRKGAVPLDLAKERVVILPCDIWATYELGMSKEKASEIMSLGCETVFKGAGVSLLKIKTLMDEAGFEALSRRLATGSYRAIHWCDSFDIATDKIVSESRDIPTLVERVIAFVKKKGEVDFEPRYVYALTIVGMGPDEGGRKRVLVIACLYDLKVKLIHSCTYYPEVLPPGTLPIQRRIASIPEQAFERLMSVAARKGR